MEIETQLKKYQSEFQPLLEEYFQKKIKKLQTVDSLAVEAVKEIRNLVLYGGKRIRPFLVCQSYFLSGGRRREAILQAALSIELVHAFLLIHDDVIDRDEKRHNIPTINKRYSLLGERFFADKNQSTHFGNSMAIIVGDLTYSLANEILFEANFSPEIILTALKKIQEIVYQTIPGEMTDLFLQARGQATEQEVLKMYDGKTARYTFEGPLHLGVCLAGESRNQKLLESLSAYALPLGQTFQLQDDILGLFGNEEKIGKAVGADVIEGKMTLLVAKALEKGNAKQKQKIKKMLGKKDLTEKNLEEFRQIIQETGALVYAQKKAFELTQKAIRALNKVKNSVDPEAWKSLKDLAEYIILRQV